MSPINVSEVINDPDLVQPFTILRSIGEFVSGVWESETTQIDGLGVIAEVSERDLDMVPEGDVVKGMRVFWSVAQIYATHATEGIGGSSDILLHRGSSYRVLKVELYGDYGYYRAVATRMKAD